MASEDSTRTILVVEDEDALRRLVVRMLNRLDYQTLEAQDGVEGLSVARSNGHEVDLILSDVVMPRLNGPTMVEELREGGFTGPVAFMSGYSGKELAGADFHQHFLLKPFTMDELQAFIESVFDAE